MRVMIAISTALSVTATLLLLMSYLIKPPSSINETSPPVSIELINHLAPPTVAETNEPAVEPKQPPPFAPPLAPKVAYRPARINDHKEPSNLEIPNLPVFDAKFENMELATLTTQPLHQALTSAAPMMLSQNAQVLVNVPPRYPISARRRNIEGQVTVEFTVNAQGKAINPTVVSATPKHLFDRAVIQSVMQMKFKPALQNGELIEQMFTYQVHFKNEQI